MDGYFSTSTTWDLCSEGPFGEDAGTPPNNDNPYRYTSRWRETEDLYYYRARYYYPESGRFLSRDPSLMSRGGRRGAARGCGGSSARLPVFLRINAIHAYLYTENNPLLFTDPSGLETGGYDLDDTGLCFILGCDWLHDLPCPAGTPDAGKMVTMELAGCNFDPFTCFYNWTWGQCGEVDPHACENCCADCQRDHCHPQFASDLQTCDAICTRVSGPGVLIGAFLKRKGTTVIAAGLCVACYAQAILALLICEEAHCTQRCGCTCYPGADHS